MTFAQVRNATIEALESFVGCPITLSDQIANTEQYPYGYYSVLAPRISGHAFGLIDVDTSSENPQIKRYAPVKATISLTFCSQNRNTENGYVYGEDEALELSEKAHCFFSLKAHSIHTEYGNIVINNIGDVSNRTGFLVEDHIRRYGFDVRLSFVLTEVIPTTTIKTVNMPINTSGT